MATSKITITLPDEQVREIRDLVAAGKAPNLSAFVQHAVRTALQDVAGWNQLLQQALEETGGPLTDKERAWVDGLLRSARQKKRARKRTAA